MNLESEEIINVVKTLDIFSFRSIVSIGGTLATALTLFGLSLSGAFTKILNPENRKTVKYMICNQVRSCTNNIVIAALVNFHFALLYYLLYPLFFCQAILSFLNSINNYKAMLLTQILFIIVSGFVSKKYTLNMNLNYRIGAFIFAVIALLQTFLVLGGIDYFLTIVVILGYVFLDGLILALVHLQKKSKAVIGLAIFRHIVLYYVFYQLLCGDRPNTILTAGALLWGICVAIEFPINILTTADIIPVTIYTVEGIKTTKSRIMQYECSKVMYKLEDGTVEVVDEDFILYISCSAPTRFGSIINKFFNLMKPERFRKNLCVELIFHGEELNKLHTYKIVKYKYIKESWILLEVRNEKTISDIIVNVNRIKKIVCQNQRSSVSSNIS